MIRSFTIILSFIFTLSINLAAQTTTPGTNKPPAQKHPLFDLAQEVLGKDCSVVVFPREDIETGNLDKDISALAQYFSEGQSRTTKLAIASFSAEATAKIIRDAFTIIAGKQLPYLSILYIGESSYSDKLKELTEAAGAKYYFSDLKSPDKTQKEDTVPLPKKLGIAGGYFSIVVPANWSFNDDDGSDPKSYMITLAGPKAENAPVMISIEYYAKGNDDFNDYVDFVKRNTWDSLTGKPLAEAQKITINGNKVLWFEVTKKTFLDPESKSDASVILKEKFYMLLDKDRQGFFVLHYSAPEEVYVQNLPAFENVAGTFKLL
jgi:hypothetical protein